ncbi:MAG: 10 kDa chaperonin [Candidatus Parcubacteria bacterium]|jgi:chaperonin GroES
MKKTVTKVDSKKISVVPLGDRVLIRPFSLDEVHTKTASGIIIPETIDKEKPRQGEVVAVGHGKMVDGKLIPLQVQVGDKVMFSYIYDELKIDGTEYYVIKEEGLLAIIK